MYPEIRPHTHGFLEVSHMHRIYYEVSGNPKGRPILFVHGGPGGGCSEKDRRFFDPAHYQIILVDQRGCGRSTPYASLEHNTTQNLIDDFETLRQHLNIKNWILFGGSWGSTLSLAYAIQHPARIAGLILRGIFLARPHEIDWLFQSGANHMHPKAWADLLEPLNQIQRKTVLSSYYQLLTDKDLRKQQKSAIAVAKWEAELSTLKPNLEQIQHFTKPDFSLALSRIEVHYLYHQCFLPPNHLLAECQILKNHPIHIVQGRYDLVCPPASAWDLSQALKQAKLVMTHAGHASQELETRQALVAASDDFRCI